jgi:hypothetical protein
VLNFNWSINRYQWLKEKCIFLPDDDSKLESKYS